LKKVDRVFHPWFQWEAYYAGFFDSCTDKMSKEEALESYRAFLSDLNRFGRGMERVFKEWPISCEQFLTNDKSNRIAWLGQSAMCIETGVPSTYRGGYKLLTPEQQVAADALAERYLERWINEYEDRKSNK